MEAYTFGRGRGNRRGGVPAFMGQEPDTEIDYESETSTLLKNVAYATIFFGAGCFVFSRRELRLA